MCWEGQAEGAGFCLDEIWSLSRERANTSPHGIRESVTVPLSLRWPCQPCPLRRQALKAKEDAHRYPRDASSRCVITLQVRAPPLQFSCKVGCPPVLKPPSLPTVLSFGAWKKVSGTRTSFAGSVVRWLKEPHVSLHCPLPSPQLFFFFFCLSYLFFWKNNGVFSLFLKFIHP